MKFNHWYVMKYKRKHSVVYRPRHEVTSLHIYNQVVHFDGVEDQPSQTNLRSETPQRRRRWSLLSVAISSVNQSRSETSDLACAHTVALRKLSRRQTLASDAEAAFPAADQSSTILYYEVVLGAGSCSDRGTAPHVSCLYQWLIPASSPCCPLQVGSIGINLGTVSMFYAIVCSLPWSRSIMSFFAESHETGVYEQRIA